MKTKIYLYLLLISFIFSSSFAVGIEQKERPKKVTNKVIDVKGNALPGVSVIVNEGSTEVTTDEMGVFNVSVKSNAVFLFELKGYESRVLTQIQVMAAEGGIVMESSLNDRINEEVNLPYNRLLKRYRTTGNIAVIDQKDAMQNDVRLGFGTAITNKIAGMSGSTNVHGLGSGVIVIDGVVADAADVNLSEIEQITVLKDPISRMLYGADGDKGVVMITTKSGTPYKKEMNFRGSFSVNDAISYPKYLNSADYMRTFNQASLNDGGAAVYSDEVIEATASGSDPYRYPDVDYYGDDFVKSMTTGKNIYGEALGGNDKVQYFLNLQWSNSDGWVKQNANISNNSFHSRGKVKAEIFSWMKIRSEITARFNVYKEPNYGKYWDKTSTYLPNVYPLLIPKERIANYDELTGEHLVDNKYLLGGTSIYQGNLIGDLSKAGNTTRIYRWLNFNNGLDFDLTGITPGLKATAQVNYQFYNSYFQSISNTYAVYEPQKGADGVIMLDENDQMTVKQIGVDKETTSQSVSEDDMDFSRRVNTYLSLNYHRIFGRHDVAATAIGYANSRKVNNVTQDDKRIAFGGNVNYMYNNKYVAEIGGLAQGSNKLNPDDRFGFAPSVGVSWIASNENFLTDNSIIDYLKLRGSYGVIQNDNFNTKLGDYSGYFLYEQIYKIGGWYTYGNGAFSSKSEMLISNIPNIYTWQQRKELSVGFDAYLFDKKTWLEATWYNSKVEDELVNLSNVPATMGGIPVVDNYDAYRRYGFDLGIEHHMKFGEFDLSVGMNYMLMESEVLKNDAIVEVDHLNKEGKRIDASMGYTALGFYQPDDFNPDGTLKEGLPVSSFGTVKPGDIKYLDYYEDGIINALDQHQIGHSGNNQICAINIDAKYRNWQFFAQANAAFGGTGYISGDYYWFKGNDAKYSEMALLSYTPDGVTGSNTNPNAIYPRLTLGNGSNNYKRSTFWAYDKDVFRLGYVQAAYNFKFKPGSVVKNMKMYVSGSNLLTVAKSKEIRDMMQLNTSGTPQTRSYTFGLIANF